ncbi:MAG: hypothetical protein PQJ59_03445 [Spirochaetales bacterium]|nr:hypothetical protein [Spirochaetales bacterium]
MHEGCSGSFEDGKQVVDKVRMMGFSAQPMPLPMNLTCSDCDKEFPMETFESKCPHCGMVYGVTPCHAFDPANVMAAGKDY